MVEKQRFYEKNRLITPVARSRSGYRLYSEKSEKQAQFILKAKSLWLSLEEIKGLIETRLDAAQHSGAEVKAIMNTKWLLIISCSNRSTQASSS